MTDNHDETDTSELSSFVNERVAPLARIFAQLPLMQLRVRTSAGMVTLVKAARSGLDVAKHSSPAKASHAPKVQEGEPGRAYDTINAEAVGVFRPAPDVPEFGERVAEDRVLGFVEALKLRNPVRAGSPCYFVAQAVEDGQAVEFGEVLFVVERGDIPPQAVSAGEAVTEIIEQAEDTVDEFGYELEPLLNSVDPGRTSPPGI